MISRRRALILAAQLGIMAGASMLEPFRALASRPIVTSRPYYQNVSARPPSAGLQVPRIVENLMLGFALGNYGHDRYERSGASSWLDFPTSTASITWGYPTDGGQWLQCQTTAGGIEQSYAYVSYVCRGGNTYLFSVNVDSKTGTHTNGNISISGGTWEPGATLTITDPAPGRHVVGGYCRSGGNIQFRIGIGTTTVNPNAATMRFSNAMLERAPKGTTYPSEYVRPGDQHAFNYSRTGSVTSGAVGAPTHGAPYAVPRRSSVLMLGDSWANDHATSNPNWGDFPFQARRYLSGQGVAINAFGLSGGRIDQITPQISDAIARQSTSSPTAVPYTLCIAYGGGNDMAQGRTFQQIRDARLAQISTIIAAGMVPILVTIPPKNDATAPQRAVRSEYNAWLPTIGYPTYDVYTDAEDGSGNFKASWGAADGVHPSNTYVGGASIMGQHLSDLIMLVGDR